MQYDFIYIKLYITQTYVQQEKTVVSWGRAAQLREAWIMKGYEETFGMMDMLAIFIMVMVSQVRTYVKLDPGTYFKHVQFFIPQLGYSKALKIEKRIFKKQ